MFIQNTSSGGAPAHSPRWEQGPEVEKRSGHMWECIGRKKEEDGYIYRFQARREYLDFNKAMEKINAIYPAIEPPPEDVLGGYWYLSPFTCAGGKIEIVERIPYFELPDPEAFLSKWRKLQESTPTLPDMSILTSEGIATDEDFVRGLIQHDVIWSNGQEFIHDFIFHLVPTVERIFESSIDYLKEQERLRQVFDTVLERFNLARNKDLVSRVCSEEEQGVIENQLEKIACSLGLIVDAASATCSSRATCSTDLDKIYWFINGLWKEGLPESNEQRFLTRRFGTELIDSATSREVIQLWGILAKLQQ